MIVADSIGEVWLGCIKRVVSTGTTSFDEDVHLLEVLGLGIKILHPSLDDYYIKKFGDKHIIEHTLDKFSKGVHMENRPFTYGQRIYDKNGVDQFNWLVDRLKNKTETKSATICLLNEGEKSLNLPCLVSIDAKIRDESLHLQFFYRSQNIIGRQYANFFALAKFQQDLARELDVSVGTLGGYIASAHIYEYDLDFAKSIIDNKDIQIVDKFYTHGPRSIRENFKS